MQKKFVRCVQQEEASSGTRGSCLQGRQNSCGRLLQIVAPATASPLLGRASSPGCAMTPPVMPLSKPVCVVLESGLM